MRTRIASGLIAALLLSYLTGLATSAGPSVVPAHQGVSTSVEAPSGLDDTIWPPPTENMVDPASITHYYPRGGKGTDYWYSLVLLGVWRGAIYERASWSLMWDLKAHMDTPRNLSLATCTFMPAAAIPACGAFVGANYWYLKKMIVDGLHQRKCLRIRFPAPPSMAYYVWQYTLVTCRI